MTLKAFNTLVIRIEGILNSRPLYPDSKDPTQPAALFPFHFETQRSLQNIPSDAIPPKMTSVTRPERIFARVAETLQIAFPDKKPTTGRSRVG